MREIKQQQSMLGNKLLIRYANRKMHGIHTRIQKVLPEGSNFDVFVIIIIIFFFSFVGGAVVVCMLIFVVVVFQFIRGESIQISL